MTAPRRPRVRQLRLVVETEDFDAAVAFYRDVLGMPVELDLQGEKGEHVVILEAGRASLELSNPAQVAMIDEIEVGQRVLRECGSRSRSTTRRLQPTAWPRLGRGRGPRDSNPLAIPERPA